MKTTKPREPEEDKFIFTEGIDYSKTEETSIWGTGDKDTLELLRNIEIHGKWLNLAAGDGRYNTLLLKKADQIVAADIDQSALDKLKRNTAEDLQKKLKTKAVNLIEPFPFDDNSFDGIFCAGTLHLFPKDQLVDIFRELDRVLKHRGQLIIDFATDIKRVLPDGTLYIKEEETQYTLDEAKEFLKTLLPDYMLDMLESSVPEEEVVIGNVTYKFNCNFLLLTGQKQ